jgi:hypothetical protein
MGVRAQLFREFLLRDKLDLVRIGQLTRSAGDRRRSLARRQGLPEQPARRARHRGHHGDQGAGAGAGRQLRRVGRAVLDI